jgi:WD40 repeat protein
MNTRTKTNRRPRLEPLGGRAFLSGAGSLDTRRLLAVFPHRSSGAISRLLAGSAPAEAGPADVPIQVHVLTRGWVAALVLFAIIGVYLVGSSQREPVKRIGLGRAAGQTRAIGFGPDGDLFVATMLDFAVSLWRIDLEFGRAELSGPPTPGFAAQFSSDGTTLAVGGDLTLALLGTSQDGAHLNARTEANHTHALAFSRDGSALAIADERSFRLWDTATARVRTGPFPVPGNVVSMAFSPDGRSLATGGEDGFLRLWDLERARQRFAVQAHEQHPVTQLKFSDDGRMLATATHTRRECKLWDASTGQALRTLRGHTEPVQAVAIAPGNSAVATSAPDGTVRLWDPETGRERAVLRGDGLLVACALAFSPDGRRLTAGGFEPWVWVWDLSKVE